MKEIPDRRPKVHGYADAVRGLRSGLSITWGSRYCAGMVMVRRREIPALTAACLLLSLVAHAGGPQAGKGLRILFVANYLFHHQTMYYANLKALLAEGGMDRQVMTHVVGELHGSFGDHAKRRLGLDWVAGEAAPPAGKARKHLVDFGKARPDVVVVQIYLGREWGNKEADHAKFVEALQEYKSACGAAGACLIICPAPGLQFRPRVPSNNASADEWGDVLKKDLESLTDRMVLCAAEMGIDVAPMPMAFAQLRAADVKVDIHQTKDIHHLSPKDAYLSACCLAATLLKDRAEPLRPATDLLEQFNAWAQKQTAERKTRNESAGPVLLMTKAEHETIHAAAWAAVSRFRGMVQSLAKKDVAAALTAGALAGRGKPGVPGLVVALSGDDRYLARNAATALGAMGAAAADAAPALIGVLSGKDRQLADRAEVSLGLIAGKSAAVADILLRECTARERRRALRAAAALGAAGPGHERAAAKALAALVQTPGEVEAKESLTRALALARKTGSQSVRSTIVAGIVEALKHPVPDIRSRAARSLGALGPSADAAAPALQEAIFTGASYKDEAIAALKKIRPGKAVSTEPTLRVSGSALRIADTVHASRLCWIFSPRQPGFHELPAANCPERSAPRHHGEDGARTPETPEPSPFRWKPYGCSMDRPSEHRVVKCYSKG